MNKQTEFSGEQLNQLVSFVVEDHGEGLDQNDFNECFLLMLEDVPCELGSLNEEALLMFAYRIYTGPITE